MTRQDPNDRPTAAEALAEFETIASLISRRKLGARIWRDKDTLSERFNRFIYRTPAL
jgi:hypothetical protein